jgi:hypothetical protein
MRRVMVMLPVHDANTGRHYLVWPFIADASQSGCEWSTCVFLAAGSDQGLATQRTVGPLSANTGALRTSNNVGTQHRRAAARFSVTVTAARRGSPKYQLNT